MTFDDDPIKIVWLWLVDILGKAAKVCCEDEQISFVYECRELPQSLSAVPRVAARPSCRRFQDLPLVQL